MDVIAKNFLDCSSKFPIITCVTKRDNTTEVEHYNCANVMYHCVEKKSIDGINCFIRSEYGTLKAKNSSIMTQIQLHFKKSF
jgi:hypothetical protein